MLTKPPFVDARRLVEEHGFYFDELLHQEIRVRIYQPAGQQTFAFEASHNMSTPVQATAYLPNSGNYATPKEALEAAAAALLTFYRAGIKAGHKPTADWLVPNADF